MEKPENSIRHRTRRFTYLATGFANPEAALRLSPIRQKVSKSAENNTWKSRIFLLTDFCISVQIDLAPIRVSWYLVRGEISSTAHSMQNLSIMLGQG